MNPDESLKSSESRIDRSLPPLIRGIDRGRDPLLQFFFSGRGCSGLHVAVTNIEAGLVWMWLEALMCRIADKVRSYNLPPLPGPLPEGEGNLFFWFEEMGNS